MIRDEVREAFRRVRRNGRTSLLAVATLALGIGAGSAVFTIAHTLLMAPPPFREPDRVVTVSGFQNRREQGLSGADFADYRQQRGIFEAMTLPGYREFSWTGQSLPGFDGAEVLRGLVVTADYFRVLDQPMAAGRGFLPDEDQPAKNQVAVLSYGLWQRRFGGRPEIVGQTITLDGTVHTVVGVTGPRFLTYEFYDVAVWVPYFQGTRYRESRGWGCLARLAPGITVAQAQERLDRFNLRLAEAYPASNKGYTTRIDPLLKNTRDEARPAMIALIGAVICLLLIAAANVASLLLARATAQAREMAIRVALGAGRMRLYRMVMAESLLLGLIAMAGGALIGVWLIHVLRALTPQSATPEWMFAIDWRVFGVAFLLSAFAGTLAGLAPAFESFRMAMGGARPGMAGSRSLRMIVTAEVALAVVLSIGAGLLGKSFLKLVERPLGYRTDHLLGLRVRLRGDRYKSIDQRAAYWSELVERAGAVAGVAKAASVSDLPMGQQYYGGPFDVADKPLRPGDARPRGHRIVASQGYFATLGIPVLSGRGFSESDAAQSEPVVIVNDLLARSVWPGENPIGKQIRVFGKDWRRVVGVVQGVRHGGPEDKVENQMYVPYRQANLETMFLVLRTHVPRESVTAAIREALKSLDPDTPAFLVRTMSEAFEGNTAGPRMPVLLTAGFAAAAALLAALGLFGVISYWVSRRTKDLGIRSALGAEAGQLRAMVLRQGLRMAAIGLAAGVGISLAVMRYLHSLLYGMSERDPAIYAAAALLSLATAAAACWLPAARAAHVDPAVALREEG
jgi:predicted permease